MLEGLPYVAILLLLLLLLLVLFLILLFIFLFLLCASRLSTRQSKVDGTLVYRSGTGEDMGSVCRRLGGVRANPMGQRALETARSRATGG